MRILVGSFAIAAAAMATPVYAAQTPERPAPIRLVIPKLSTEPRLDDFITMNPAPDTVRPMARVEGFTQRWPDDGKPERMKTVAFLGYTDEALHVVYLAFDPDPSALRAHLLRREEVFTVNDDAVELRLDTYGDQRQSYYFVANPLGVQLDAAWPEVGGQYDDSFDLVWHSRGQRTGDGFVVLMSIPFRSLRFRPSAEQEWGIYLGRWIPRTGEWNFWPPISIRQQSYLAQMARLDGIRNVTRGRGVQLIPYASARAFRAFDQRDRERPGVVRDLADPSIGLDAKLVVRDALVLDATANPDFSQVESDAPQITANQRFEVFFPEKRPFFLENAGFLQTPINLMFTRRIADPQVGVKLTGRAGAWSVGSLVADDQAPGKRVVPSDPLSGSRAWVTVARASRNLIGQSSIGAIVSHRAVNDRTNTVSGLDSRVRFRRVWTVDSQLAFSQLARDESTPVDRGSAYFLSLARNGRSLHMRTELDGRSPDFATDLGFVPRLDVHEATQTIGYTSRPASALADWGPTVLVERVWAHDGTPLDWRARPSIAFNFQRATSFSAFAEQSEVTLRPGDAPQLTTATAYRPNTWGVTASSSPRPAWGASMTITRGTGINFAPAVPHAPDLGDQSSSRLSLSVRPMTPLRIENTWLRSALESGGSRAFVTHILRSQWAWQFTREWSLRFIGQYESTSADALRSSLTPRRNFNGDVLLTRLINPWTALYLGYNGNAQNLALSADPAEQRLVRTEVLQRDAWQVFAKWSHLLRW
jgi:hypothetical protein